MAEIHDTTNTEYTGQAREPESEPDGDLPPEFLFQPVERGESKTGKFVCGWQAIRLAKYALAIADGTALLMQVNENDNFEMTTDAPKPIFDTSCRVTLEGFVWAANRMLALEASMLISDAEQKERRETD